MSCLDDAGNKLEAFPAFDVGVVAAPTLNEDRAAVADHDVVDFFSHDSNIPNPALRRKTIWFRDLESNQDWRSQSALSYRLDDLELVKAVRLELTVPRFQVWWDSHYPTP